MLTFTPLLWQIHSLSCSRERIAEKKKSISLRRFRRAPAVEENAGFSIFLAARRGYPDLLSVLATYRVESYPRAIFPPLSRRFSSRTHDRVSFPRSRFFPSSIYVLRTHHTIPDKTVRKIARLQQRTREKTREANENISLFLSFIRNIVRRISASINGILHTQTHISEIYRERSKPRSQPSEIANMV